ncbi:MAG TPA: hypothetical protein VHX86_08410 [Tepidisphaeraceae bacterium]|nr:hypothetical protein [Tepidisphaeraceae bacterium]
MSQRRGDASVGYQLFTGDPKTGWRSASVPHNPLIRGDAFELHASDINKIDDDRILLRGTIGGDGKRGNVGVINWRATIIADAARGWFAFDIEVNAEQDIHLWMQNGFEPEIMLDLGPLPPYERGDHVWFITQITNPTKWNDDAYGNDFPATYYFDPYLNVEIMLFFDMTRMSWMSRQNVARFLNYRCGFRRRYQPEPAGELGLYATGASGQVFPSGVQHFSYFLRARPRKALADDHEAVRLLVDKCLPLLPQKSPWPSGATSWRDFAHHCAEDLMTEGLCWRKAEGGHEFILNYVDGYSPAWKEAIEARGNRFDMIKPCFDAAVWIAHPLAVLSRVDRRDPVPQLYQRVSQMIDQALRTNETPFAPDGADTVSGTWQHLYILEELFQLGRLWKNQSLLDRVVDEVNDVVIPLAKWMSYLFPLSFNRRTIERAGAGDCHAVLGTYANFMLDLHEMTASERYLEESRNALQMLHRLPVNTIHQEVFLLAMGTQAAYRLSVMHPLANYEEIYHYLLAQTLRMLYWYADRTTEQSGKINTLGMFQACATISYPALFENIEVLARLCPTFKRFPPSLALLRVVDHARKNNFYFFPRCFDSGRGTLPLQYIPFENIPILEGPAPGSVGQEIYGSGWVFRACLMWETFGHAEDRDIMVLNLDAFEERRHLEQGRLELTFIVFNGTDKRQQAQLVFPWSGVSATIATGESPDAIGTGERRGQRLQLDLDPDAVVYVRVSDSIEL